MKAARTRAVFACCLLAVCFTGFSFRLIILQVVRHDEYSARAANNHVVRQEIYAKRGTIQDFNHEVLADNEPIRTVVADGSLLAEDCDRAEAAMIVAGTLKMDERELARKLATDDRYVIIKKRVPEPVAQALEARLREPSTRLRPLYGITGTTVALEPSVRRVRGIFFEQDSSRIYPNGSMLCHVLGFMNGEHKGVQGIEMTMNDYLTGHDGFRFIERTREGKEIVPYRGQERAPRNGCNVRLTIDMGLQNIVETELNTAVKQFKPKKAIVILMRPKTGEILAMANRPNFDVNHAGEGEPEQMKNAAIIDMMEPGSTFKIVTAAAALNEKAFRHDDMIFCENGFFNFGGRPLHDHHPYADLSVDDILMKSSNIGAAKLAMKLGEQKFYEYIRRFGFGERTGVNLPGEIGGVIHPPHRWSKISITRIPMGQEVGVTPLQMVTAMSAIANGGDLMMPQIVHEIVDDQGTTIANFPPVKVRSVVSAETARQVRDALKSVVTAKGTAALAKVAGFTVAGKTGTAQKVDPKGGYMSGKFIVSFIGMLPADDPEFVCLVMLDDAQTKADQNYGGTVAAPIFSRIAEKVARYLGLQPEPDAPANKELPANKLPPSKIILTQARVGRDQ